MVLIDGKAGEHIDALDRGFLYGHTVFETIGVIDGRPRFLNRHLQRLAKGAQALGIPYREDEILSDVHTLCESIDRAVLRITLSIGGGGRGYQSPESPQSRRIAARFAWPEPIQAQPLTVGISALTLSHQPLLAGLKHGNRLEQILIRQQWKPDWDEALVFDVNQHLIEGTQTNMFLRQKDELLTPDLSLCGVAGVMREVIIESATRLGITLLQRQVTQNDLLECDELILCNSIKGLLQVGQICDPQARLSKTFNADDFTLITRLTPEINAHGAL